MIEEWIPVISNVGFPIVIALYTIVRLENTINKNTQAILELRTMILTEMAKHGD